MASEMAAAAAEQEDSEGSLEICRLCMSAESLENVFEASEGLQQWISDYLSIEVSISDTISHAICTICRIRLAEFHQFRMHCMEVQDVLWTMILTKGPPVETTVVEEVSTPNNYDGAAEEQSPREPIEQDVIPFGNKFQCGICKKVFTRRKQVMDHKRFHGPKKYACDYCDRKFPIRGDLTRHLRLKSDDPDHAQVEGSSSKLMATDGEAESDATEMKSLSRPLGENEHWCHECHKMFKVRAKFKDHMRLVHGERKLACPVCDKRFIVPSQLKLHVRKHATPYKCNDCKRSFRHEDSFWSHRIIEHNFKPFRCTICRQGFALRRELHRHMGTHLKNEEVLYTNEDTIHSDKGEPVDELQSIDNLEEQEETKFGIGVQLPKAGTDNEQDKQEPFQCDVCQRTYTKMRQLLDHKRLIHGERKFACDICSKRFASASGYDRHLVSKLHLKKVARMSSSIEDSIKSETGAVNDESHSLDKTDESQQDQTIEVEASNWTTDGAAFEVIVRPHEEDERKHACPICDQRFVLPHELDIHMRNHIYEGLGQPDDRPFVKIESLEELHDSTKAKSQPLEMETEQLLEGSSHHTQPEEEVETEQEATFELTSVETIDIEHVKIEEPVVGGDPGEDRDETPDPVPEAEPEGTQAPPKEDRCVQCNKVFAGNFKLKDHMRLVHGEKKHACPFCDKRFILRSQMKLHARTHDQEYPFKCNVCEKDFKYENNLWSHKRRKHKLTRYSCPVCREDFALRQELKRHLRSTLHQKNAEESTRNKLAIPFEGDWNNSDQEQDVLETLELEEQKQPLFWCEKCPKKFMTRLQLKLHRRHVHDDRNHVCSVCYQRFTTPYHLRIHQKKHKKEKPYQCNVCQKNYKHEAALWFHKRNIHNLKLYACQVCNEQFSLRRDLEDHLRSKDHLRNVEIFSRNVDSLKSEKGEAHDDEKIKLITEEGVKLDASTRGGTENEDKQEQQQFQCDECPKIWPELIKLKNHKRLVHGEKKHTCEICDKSFIRLSRLRRHLRTHDPDNIRFGCNICEKTFKQAQHLWAHKRKLHSLNTCSCRVCGKQFLIRHDLDRHLRTKLHLKNMKEWSVNKRLIIYQRKEAYDESDSNGTTDKTTDVADGAENDGVLQQEAKIGDEQEKSHQCDQCPKKFARYKRLMDHKRMVHGEKKHECTVCGKRFAVPSILSYHMKTHEMKT